MAKKSHNPAARLKKLLTNLVVLLVFLFPLTVSAAWIYNIFNSGDKRDLYSQKDLDGFRKVECPDLSDVRPFEEPLITITFDDGWESIYSQGVPVMESFCMKSTQYILGDHFEDFNYMSEAQARAMQKNGHEIASHTMDHPNLTKLSDADMDWELGESDRLLSEKFGEIRDFATPLGASDERVLSNIKKYYRSHRNTVGDPATVGDEDINTADNFDIFQINAYTVRRSTTLDDIRNLIEHTKKRNGWLILTYHQVDDSNAFYGVSRQQLEEQLKLVHESGLRTPVMGDVLDAIGSRGRQ